MSQSSTGTFEQSTSLQRLVDETWPEPEYPRAPSSLLKGTFIVVTNPWNAYPPFVAGPGVTAPDPPSPRVLPSAAVNSLRFSGSSIVWGQLNVRSLLRDNVTGETTVTFSQPRVDGEYYLWKNTQSNFIEGRMELRLAGGNAVNQLYLLRRTPGEWYMVLKKFSIVNPSIPDLQNASNAMLLRVRNSWLDYLF